MRNLLEKINLKWFTEFKYNKNNYYIWYFFAAIIFYLVYKMIKMPGMLFDGEMWAEMATNYYPNAISGSIMQSLFATDAGYWALPQRIIALIGTILHLPPKIIPYYYSWTACILTSVMFAVFCFPVFRKIVVSDFFRFIICIALLTLTNFQTSTFINFTYYSSFLIIILSALALKEGKKGNIPVWAWVIPFLILSKPVVMATIPIMVFISFFACKRYRNITIVSVFCALAQAIRLIVSLQAGVMLDKQSFNLTNFDKIFFGCKKFFEIIPNLLFGKLYYSSESIISAAVGIVIVTALIFFIKKTKMNHLLAIIGLLLIFLSVMFLFYSVPLQVSSFMGRVYITRYTTTAIIGAFFIIINYAEVINNKINNLGLILFVIYFSICWVSTGVKAAKEPHAPLSHCSQWMNMHALIGSKQSICVPINPYAWQGVYRQGGCHIIARGTNGKSKGLDGLYTLFEDNTFPVDIDTQNSIVNSFVMNVRPHGYLSKKRCKINAKARLTYEDNQIVETVSEGNLHHKGSTLMFFIPETDKKIKNISFEFNRETEIYSNGKRPKILWFGTEKEREQ